MREYELTVVYDLAVAESGGPDASVKHLSHAVEVRGGSVVRVDHWGRRRMAYPIRRAIDADYVVSRVNLEPSAIDALEAALRIDEKVYRHLIVRADELPPPPVPREPRRQPGEAAPAPAGEAAPAPAAEAAPAPVADATAAVAEAPATVAEASPTVPESAAPVAEAAAMGAAEASPAADAPAEGTAPASGTDAEPSA